MAETLVVGVIVSAAVLFIGRRAWRAVQSARRASAGGCDAGCGCDTGAAAPPRDWAER
jgi:FeoB-associated Cys-rich membrane protein